MRREWLERLREVVPSQVKVTVVADRGFGDCKLFKTIAQELGFAYVIRIRGDIYVTSAKGERRKAAQWVGQGGRSRTLRGAQVTDEHHLEVGRVVCVHDRKMKEPWCLVASESTVGTRTLIRYYGKRWGIETSFRDIKDMRFGWGCRRGGFRARSDGTGCYCSVRWRLHCCRCWEGRGRAWATTDG